MVKKYILLVEDNADDEALFCRACKKSTFDMPVVVKRDGEEALTYLRTVEDLPHVVLLDLRLPRLNGIDVLRELRRHSRTQLLPVVILSSSDEQGDIDTCYEIGANSYVCKPIETVQYQKLVEHLHGYWLTFNQSPVESLRSH